MFDIASSEFFLVLLIALVVIGPKDLPKVLRVVGKWVGKGRAIVAQFRAGIDDMVRESELKELEEKWKKQNEDIMREYPQSVPPESGEDEAVKKEPQLPLSSNDGPQTKEQGVS
ncbi:MAG: twin-arginine translocase subunit TatB [Sphingomonadales bacterium]|nr:twin-arginine translocase subunit TatB [Sphingomonadales bacterium]